MIRRLYDDDRDTRLALMIAVLEFFLEARVSRNMCKHPSLAAFHPTDVRAMLSSLCNTLAVQHINALSTSGAAYITTSQGRQRLEELRGLF